MPCTIYFSHPDTRAVQPVRNCIATPTIFIVGNSVANYATIYKEPHRDIFEEFFGDEIGSASSIETNYSIGASSGYIVSPGLSGGGGIANSSSTKLWVPKPLTIGTTTHHSDERVHAPHRQDTIKHNFWKVLVTVVSGQPDFYLIPYDLFPVFSNAAPSGYIDPTPDA